VIYPPITRRWWFIAGNLLCLACAVAALYRYRLTKALLLERTRSRIAMDLHDDIGSSLTRISVLSEVARRQNGTAGAETLAKIGTTARELIDALDDIVWAVDPRHDTLMDIVRRIVEFGQQVCEGRGIQFETVIADSFDGAKVRLDRRRDLYLLFKEAINNAVRHSGASTVTFRVGRMERSVVLTLEDDGKGLSPDPVQDGNGLRSMQERGIRSGDRFTILAEPGRGTRMLLEIRTG
jgi:signal transduction histidine kinase